MYYHGLFAWREILFASIALVLSAGLYFYVDYKTSDNQICRAWKRSYANQRLFAQEYHVCMSSPGADRIGCSYAADRRYKISISYPFWSEQKVLSLKSQCYN